MSNGTQASDVITYIGVPLAVLGVAPIIYNTAATLLTVSKVRRILRKSRLAGRTRGDVINHVIEVELPRFIIAPLDRDDSSGEYWSIYDSPSLIPGGSWTIFNWKMHTIGLKVQRFEYTDQLRQPQAEVGFEELISYLMDLGAVPSATGFRMLRTTGLWVPVGTPLLLSPDRNESMLMIAPLDDSDGHLSLAVRWSREWRMRDRSALPPYWTRIKAPPEQPIQPSVTDEEASLAKKQGLIAIEPQSDLDGNWVEEHSPHDPGTKLASSIRCHISLDGLMDAATEDPTLIPIGHLDISHLGTRTGLSNSRGSWFASAATALGATGDTVLWNYNISESILSFSRKETVPCGILVLLNVVEEAATPEWATTYEHDKIEEQERTMKRLHEESSAILRDRSMTTEQKSAAFHERSRQRAEDWFEDLRKAKRREEQRAETKMMEALQSPRWDSKLVAEHNLNWLKAHKFIGEKEEIKGVVEGLLFKMLTDREFTTEMTKVLDAWKVWVDNGGMRKADFNELKQNQEMFAYASLIVFLIRDSVTAVDGSLATDLQESVRIWKKVRLG